MPNLTPLEAAEIMEESARQAKCMIDAPTIFFSAASQSAGVERVKKCEMAYSLAASYLRAIAAGEYKQVVYAHWVRINDTQEQMCSECGQSYDIYAYRQDDYTHCPSCGARMDGKDENYEPDAPR